MDQRIAQADHALSALRSRVVLLDQVDDMDELITTIRADVLAACAESETPTNGAEATALLTTTGRAANDGGCADECCTDKPTQ